MKTIRFFALFITCLILCSCEVYDYIVNPQPMRSTINIQPAKNTKEKISAKPLKPDLFELKWRRYVGKKNYLFTCHPLILGNLILHATNGDKDGADSFDRLYAFDKDGACSGNSDHQMVEILTLMVLLQKGTL